MQSRNVDFEHIAYRFKTSAAATSSLVADPSGALYGTRGMPPGGVCTGPSDCGSVFRLTPTPSGYSETVVYRFRGGPSGADPEAALIEDPSGALYGTTASGGYGYGTVFKLTPSASGFKERVLYRFLGGNDGSAPETPLFADGSGALWGTTSGVGTGGFGTVFKLTPGSRGYTESYVYSFASAGGSEGMMPSSALVMDKSGTLHGVTVAGPGIEGNGSPCWPMGCGGAYVVAPSGSSYALTMLYWFSGPDGAFPSGGLTLDGNGPCVIGTTPEGGTFGAGNVFEQCGDTLFVLHNFAGGTDGAQPLSGVHLETQSTTAARVRTFVGTTDRGGDPACGSGGCGTVFRLIGSGANYQETVLHRFGLKSGDGTFPGSGLTYANGTFVGTTDAGGNERACLGGCGTVFQIGR